MLNQINSVGRWYCVFMCRPEYVHCFDRCDIVHTYYTFHDGIIFDYRSPYIPLAQLISVCYYKIDWVNPENVSDLNGGKVYKFSNSANTVRNCGPHTFPPHPIHIAIDLSHKHENRNLYANYATVVTRAFGKYDPKKIAFYTHRNNLRMFRCGVLRGAQKSLACCEHCTFILSFAWCVLFLLNN